MKIQGADENLREKLDIQNYLIMYVGNLELYQGIDLLLESFSIAISKNGNIDLVIIGGTSSDIDFYKRKAESLSISNKVHWLGPRPVESLKDYLNQADILVSPRVKGINTPMKLYSYLGSGKPTLVTDLLTHTQVVNAEVAMLAAPYPDVFAEAMLMLIDDDQLRVKLGTNGKALVEKNFSYSAYRERFNELFDWLEQEIQLN